MEPCNFFEFESLAYSQLGMLPSKADSVAEQPALGVSGALFDDLESEVRLPTLLILPFEARYAAELLNAPKRAPCLRSGVHKDRVRCFSAAGTMSATWSRIA